MEVTIEKHKLRLNNCAYKYTYMKYFCRYGGTYLDLDVISQKPLDSIPETNFACSQIDDLSRTEALANGILSLDINKGHHIADLLLRC